ncbi:MAG: hypothetical protein CXZ00_16515 [Acidobacteria bacterium]|nr:MAG: hypothetical protein CXZ00_16515 [Acidobacteriota bacterium]
MPNTATTFVHLSDIHFRKNANTPYDAFADLRNELELDSATQTGVLGGVYGLLVGGDIAFSGQPTEYDIASGWLRRFASCLNIDPDEKIWVVPGNHDVNRGAIEKSVLIQHIHKDLRADAATIDDKLASYMVKDEEAKKLILRPIQSYNDFAARFQCDIYPEKPYWEHDVTLNDGSCLRMRGLNSAIVSDELDSDASHKLVLGKRQMEFTRQDGVEYLALCHHPPQWLFDQDVAEDLFGKRSRIQLFGHKHRQRLTRIEDGVRIASGAMQPDEREPNWQPRYNFIQVSVEQNSGRRVMLVRVYPRVYREDVGGGKFMPEIQEGGNEYRDFILPLPEWQSSKQVSPTSAGEDSSSSAAEAVHVQRGIEMWSARKLTYKFLSLPHHLQLAIAQELDLVRDEDEGARDNELYRRYFIRAQQENKLDNLKCAVEKYSAQTDKTGAA